MKKIILIFLSVFLLAFCGSLPKNNWAEIGNDGVMIMSIDRNMNHYQLDSLCVSDTLSLKLEDWIKWQFIEEDSKKTIEEYVYIKETDRNTTYKLRFLSDSLIHVTKRTIKQN